MEIIRSKPLKEFLKKILLFLVIFFIIKYLTSLALTGTEFYKTYLEIPQDFYFLYGSNFGILIQSILFIIVAFILFNKENLRELESFERNKKQTILFLIISFLFLFFHYLLKYYINQNLDFALQYSFFFALLKLLLNVLFTIFLFLAIFNTNFTFYFIKKFKKSIPLFTLAGIVYYFAFLQFQNLWKFFSTIVTKVLYYAFSVTHDKVIINLTKGGPILGVNEFIVKIGKPCSGIDSMLLFTSLYALIMALDHKVLNLKRALLLFPIGLVGIFAFNIIRVYLLMLIGIHVSEDFAIGLFHQNVGWILFIIYFAVFYSLTRKHLYK